MTGVAPTAPSPMPDGAGKRLRIPARLRPSSVLVAALSTIVVFGAIGWVIVTSPGWPLVQHDFFSAQKFVESFPAILFSLWKNIQIFAIAEVLILILALGLAVMRSLPGPVFFPLRLMSVAYIDIFRGVPSILVIFLLGFGIPGLRIKELPPEPFIWGLVSLVLVWSAYVAEVYRAGIESVHPSQEAAARSLGLSRMQGLRYVVLPQAVRRVLPPLLNDFIGLQKDTALVSFIGVIEVFRRTQLEAASFNFTPYLACGLIFLILTIPLARAVDYLASRDRRRQLAGVAR